MRILGLPFGSTWIPSETQIAVFDSELGWNYIPNSTSIQKFGTDQSRVKLSFNNISARVSDPKTRFDQNKPTIILVGCSVAMGHGVEYVDTIGGRLEHYPDFPYQVVNIGVQAYGTDQALLKLQRYIKQFNVKAVVYVFIKWHLLRNRNYDRRVMFPDAKFIGTKPLFELDNSGQLVITKRPVKFENYSYSRLWARWKIWDLRRSGEPTLDPLSKTLILELKNVSLARGANFTVIDWRHSYTAPSVLESLEIDLIDLAKNAPPNIINWNIPGDGHPNKHAHSYASTRLIDHYKSIKLIP